MILLLPSVGAFEVIFANQSTSIKKGFSVLRARKGAGMAAAGRGSRLGQDWECVRECLTVCVCVGGWGAADKGVRLLRPGKLTGGQLARSQTSDKVMVTPPPIVTEGSKDLWLSVLNSLPVVHFISLR